VSQPIFDIARLPITDPLLVGRKAELARLDKAWKANDTGVITVVGRGGEGKTALVNAWLARLGKRGWLENKRVYGWTFYSQGTTSAGVSLAVKEAVAPHENLFPSWTGLLLHGAARIQAGDPARADLIRALLGDREPDYLQAATRLRAAMRGPVWPDFLKEQLDPLRDSADDHSLALARAVWNLGSRLILTTNYDRVLDWACPDHHDLRRLDNSAVAKFAQLAREPAPRPTVWHLHGHIDNIEQMVLTADSYHALYGSAVDESRYQAALTTLQGHLAGRTLLFIGFSLDDPFVAAQLRGVFKRFHGHTGTAFALIREADARLVQAHVDKHEFPVEIVPFGDFGQPLLDLVRALAPGP
jgi:hypothetical protein